MTNFKVGQKVVCIKTSYDGIKNVVEGEIYTIVSFTYYGLGVQVKEAIPRFITNGFWAHRFRPVENYLDATQEILSKFKPIECTPGVEIKVHETAN
jgi:hypothetical protein